MKQKIGSYHDNKFIESIDIIQTKYIIHLFDHTLKRPCMPEKIFVKYHIDI